MVARCVRWLTVLCFIGGAGDALAQDRDACSAAVLSVAVGVVVISPATGAPFVAEPGTMLCPGDRARVEPASGGLALVASEGSPQGAIWFPGAQKLIRIAPDTEVAIPLEPAPQRIRLLRGLVYILSVARRTFAVETDLLTAGIAGTEAAVHRVAGAGAVASVRAGEVSVRQSGAASLALGGGETAFSPEAGLLRRVGPDDAARLPPVFRQYVVSPTGAADWAIHFPLPVLAAGGQGATAPVAMLIAERRFAEAGRALSCGDAPAGRDERAALCAMLAVTLDHRGPGGVAGPALAEYVAEAPPGTASHAWFVAQSYVRQALGQPEAARGFAESAVEANPGDPFTVARLAEIELILGDAPAAVARLEPLASEGCEGEAHVQTVLGLALLAAYRFDEAARRLDCAVTLDGAAPLGWTARGLAKIRRGDLAGGRADIEVAAALDPRQASTRLWLGRALLDEDRPGDARKALALAIEEDPDDPAAHLAAAVERFAANDPIAALRAIETAQARGAGRATLRSAAGLAEDSAVRGAALGRVYDVLGLDQLARSVGARAADADPANPEAHRFLAGVYRARTASEFASTSSLLRADLLTPPTRAPLQPQLGEVNLGLLATAGPTRLTFAEFGPAFDADGVRFDGAGVAGSESTLGGEASVAALHERASLALAASRSDTDGYRDNNDLTNTLFAGQARLQLSPSFGLFAEARHRDTDAGDMLLNFDSDDFDPGRVFDYARTIGRIGFRLQPAPEHTLIGLASVGSLTLDRVETAALSGGGAFTGVDKIDRDGWDLQIQHIGAFGPLRTVVGAGRLETEEDSVTTSVLSDPFFGDLEFTSRSTTDLTQSGAYAYGYLTLPRNVDWTLGASIDRFDGGVDGESAETEFNPKLGVSASFGPITLRGAYIESTAREVLMQQTLEPASVAGFVQFTDTVTGSEVRRTGFGVDVHPIDDLWFGVETTFDETRLPGSASDFSIDDDVLRAYASYALTDRLIVGVEYSRERSEASFPLDFSEYDVDALTASLSYFDASGVFAGGEVAIVDHSFTTQPDVSGVSERRSSDFAVVNAFLGYRFPDRRGVASLEVLNLLDADVDFQDRNYRDDVIVAPRFARGLTVRARLSLTF